MPLPTNSITLNIQLFGALKKYSSNGVLKIEVFGGSNIEDVKNKIINTLKCDFPDFSDIELINKSVLANECRILNSDEIFETNMQLVIMPPVCGG